MGLHRAGWISEWSGILSVTDTTYYSCFYNTPRHPMTAGRKIKLLFCQSQTPHTTAVLQHTSQPNDSRQENQSAVLSLTDTTYYSCFTIHLATQWQQAVKSNCTRKQWLNTMCVPHPIRSHSHPHWGVWLTSTVSCASDSHGLEVTQHIAVVGTQLVNCVHLCKYCHTHTH